MKEPEIIQSSDQEKSKGRGTLPVLLEESMRMENIIKSSIDDSIH